MSHSKVSNTVLKLPQWAWRSLQVILWIVGVVIVACLLFAPELGINLFWNLLIPVAPAVVVLVPGIWRNICPMSSTALAARKFGFSKRQKLSSIWQGRFFLLAVVALWLIVPLRHVVFNLNGPATALMLLGAAGTAIALGRFFEWRSSWCSSLCPIHPVERLYGSTPLVTVENAHCSECEECVSICPDSTRQMSAVITRKITSERFAGNLMVGGFVGYIWGWYRVADIRGNLGAADLAYAYAWPVGCGLISMFVYLLVVRGLNKQQKQWLDRSFAAAAVICYYWYRIPALVGVGIYPGDGMLIDLSRILPIWFPIASQLICSTFFIWFMLMRPNQKRSWSERPEYSSLIATSRNPAVN